MYKDKGKQREANRKAKARQRGKGMTKGMTKQGMTIIDEPPDVIPDSILKRGKDIKYIEDLHPGIQASINETCKDKDGKIDQHEHKRRTAIAINYQHLYPDRYEPLDAVCTGVVTGKPGDADYDGVCTPEWIAEQHSHEAAKAERVSSSCGTTSTPASVSRQIVNFQGRGP